MVKVKICGLKKPEEIKLCAALDVAWAGFVFYPPSPRFITPQQALALHQAVPPSQEGGPQRVGLFVAPSSRDIKEVLDVIPLDILQLYAPLAQVLAFRKEFALPVWQARGIKTRADLPSQKNALDGYVIEAPPDLHDNQPGGLGKSFDWQLTRNWPALAPWLLAGGLTPENVATAIKTSGAPAIDVSSGVEETRGIKSLEKIEKFVRNASNGVA